MQLVASIVSLSSLVATATAQYAPWAVSVTYAPEDRTCQQVACWISTRNAQCAIAVADQIQRDVFKGRDGYGVEKRERNGMWVRYWRTKVEPQDRGVLVRGRCSDKTAFIAENCQSTGQVKC